MNASTSQLRAIAERCVQAAVKPHDLAVSVFGVPPVRLDRDQASDLVRLLVDGITHFTYEDADPLQALLDRRTLSEDTMTNTTAAASSSFTLRRKTDTETWVEWAAGLLNLSTETECGHCSGTGSVTASPTRKTLTQHILDYSSTTGVQMKTFQARVANPDLDTLRRVANRLNAGLEDAARFCTTLARHIAEDLK